MQLLMDQFKNAFDLVIYDTPPLLGLADARLVASKTDGIVMVVALDKTEGSELTQALEGLKLSPTSVLGIIANGAKDHESRFHASYQRYYMSGQPKQIVEETTPLKQIDE